MEDPESRLHFWVLLEKTCSLAAVPVRGMLSLVQQPVLVQIWRILTVRGVSGVDHTRGVSSQRNARAGGILFEPSACQPSRTVVQSISSQLGKPVRWCPCGAYRRRADGRLTHVNARKLRHLVGTKAVRPAVLEVPRKPPSRTEDAAHLARTLVTV